MEGTEGMVAVVRGLQDSSLAVTLLDGAREYTLVPNSVINAPAVGHKDYAKHQATQHYTSPGTENCIRNMGAQAADGRYTSTYRRSHCHVKPTSPPVELTEFPPQRAELCPGHGNFEVGGIGSGETHSAIRATGNYRGGMVWPDRGSVCTPRTSSPPVDHFARSLRKYPSMSPERSTEIVERLVNYSQSKNSAAKTHTIRNQTTPQRLSNVSSSYDYPRSSRHPSPKTPPHWEPASNTPDRGRLDESPTRECKSKKAEGDGPDHRKQYNRNYDVKCLRDIAKRVKENARLSVYPFTQPVCPHIRDIYSDNHSTTPRFRPTSTNKANSESQAAVRMVSKEVATVPIVPGPSVLTRTVAISLSPTVSVTEIIGGECRLENKSNQTSFSSTQIRKRKSHQTVSVTELPNKENVTLGGTRRSRSQEHINISDEDAKTNLQKWLGSIDLSGKTQNITKTELLKMSYNIVDNNKNTTKCSISINSIPVSPISNDRVKFKQKIDDNKDNSIFNQAEKHYSKYNEVNLAISNWLKSIPFKSPSPHEHCLCSGVDATRIYHAISNIFRNNMSHVFESDSTRIKTELLEIIQELPVEVGCYDESLYFNTIVDSLLDRIRNTFIQHDEYGKRNISVRNVSSLPHKFQKYPTEYHLKQLIRKQLIKYVEKYNLGMCKHLMQGIQNELADVIINSINSFCSENDFRFQMKYILTDVADLSDVQADNFIDDILNELARTGNIPNNYHQTYTVLPHTLQNSILNSNNAVDTVDFSMKGITQGDLNANMERYMDQLCQQINVWLTILNVNQLRDECLRHGVRELAGNIIERHKYLKTNPSSRGSDEDQLDYLRYQIFKWVNKYAGDNNKEVIHHAEDLLQRIRNVPMPMFIIPGNKNMACHCHGQDSCQCTSTKCSGYLSPQRSTMNSSRRMRSPDRISLNINDPGTGQKQRLSSPGAFSLPAMLQNDNIRNITVATVRQGAQSEKKMEDLLSIQQLISSEPTGPNPGSNDDYQQIEANERNIPIAHERNAVEQSQRVERHETTSRQEVERPKDIPKTSSAQNTSIQHAEMRKNNLIKLDKINTSPTPINENRRSSIRADPNVTGMKDVPPDSSYRMSPSLKKLNEEYDEYLKQWVREIPMPTVEATLAETLRLGIYNGIWKALTKLRFDPAIITNRFYYQDVLDDEIEELLNLLPSSPELEKKRHMMKAKLIEKTSDTNEQVLSSVAPSTYKQQLVEAVERSLPITSRGHSIDESAKAHKDLLKQDIAEDFILYARFKCDDGHQAQVYKNKLHKNTEDLVNNVRHHYGDLKDMDPDLYVNKVLTALNEVPVPHENTAREEAEEILLGIEIDKWFLDLPYVQNNSYKEQLQKRRLRDSLARNIHEILKVKNLLSDAGRKELSAEISKLLDKLSMKEGADKKFVINELINRLKNKPKESTRRKSVAFKDNDDFDAQVFQQFGKNIPACSSFIEPLGISSSQYNPMSSPRSRNQNFNDVNNMPSEIYPQTQSQTINPNRFQMSTGSQYIQRGEPSNWSNVEPSGEQWVSLLEITPELAHYVISANRTYTYVDQTAAPNFPNQIVAGIPPDHSRPGPKEFDSAKCASVANPSDGCCHQPACEIGMNDSINQARSDGVEHKSAHIPSNQGGRRYQMAGGGMGILGTSQVAGPSGVDYKAANIASNQERRMYQMAGGGMGILGTSQVAGPSGFNYNAANTASNQERRLYQMAGGGMGILGTSQVAGPSGVKHYVLTKQDPGSGGVEHFALGTTQVVDPSSVQSYGPTAPSIKQFQNRPTDHIGIQETMTRQGNIENPAAYSTPGKIPFDQPLRFPPPQPVQPTLPQSPSRGTRPITTPLDGNARRPPMGDFAAGRIDKEKYERCKCLDRLRRRRKSTICPCDEYTGSMRYPRFIPVMCPYPYFL